MRIQAIFECVYIFFPRENQYLILFSIKKILYEKIIILFYFRLKKYVTRKSILYFIFK